MREEKWAGALGAGVLPHGKRGTSGEEAVAGGVLARAAARRWGAA